jgi:PAS domain S-box-containing protein
MDEHAAVGRPAPTGDRRLDDVPARVLDRVAAQVPGVLYQYLVRPDGSHCFPYVSEGVWAVFEITPEGLSADAELAWDRIHPEDRPHVASEVDRSNRTLEPWSQDFRVVLPDKGERWLRGEAQPAREPDGTTLWYGYITDITDRVRSEEERLAALEQVESFFDVALDLLCIADHHGRFVKLNPSWSDVLGYPLEELVGRPYVQLVHPDDVDATVRAMNELGAQKEIVGFVNRYRHRDGSYRYIEWRSKPRDGLVFGAARDVTAAHEREAALRSAKEAAEEASRAKSLFLANMSHEIRTPMNGVLGATELLGETPLDAEQRELVETVRSSGESLMGVINDILDFSRVEAGRIELESIPLDLEDVVRKALAPLRLRRSDSKVALHFEVGSDFPRGRRGDPGRIRQITVNLVGNALKFTEVGEVRVELREDGDDVVIAVSDTGIGIPEARQGALFEPFEQVEASTARRFGGTGLGLAISRRLASAMGGRIDFESEVGRGSRFEVHLPLPRDEGPTGLATGLSAVSTAFDGTRLRILLVEDNRVNREVATRMLARIGLGADVANDGQEAVACATTNRYDVIFMDVQMPGMDGYEATARIRAHEAAHGRPPVPIVALTANAMASDRERALEAGMNEHLAKPLRGADLEAVLRTVLPSAERSGDLAEPIVI